MSAATERPQTYDRRGVSEGSVAGIAVRLRPWRLAATVAVIYGTVSAIYIRYSTALAASIASDTAQLERIEQFKGIAFVAVSTTLLFLGLWLLFRHLSKRELMIERQRASLIAADQRAAAGLFAASIAHDLNNVLMVCQGCLHMLSGDRPLERRERAMADLSGAIERIAGLSIGLSEAGGRQFAGGFARGDLVVVVSKAVALAKRHRKVRHCRIETVLPESLVAEIDASVIHRLMLNLLINAGDATEGRGAIRITLSDQAGMVRLMVEDDGPGIAPALRERVLEPFYTTKSDGSGLGFLSLKLCADLHQGRIDIGASALGGAGILIEFPVLRDSSDAAETRALPAS